MTQRARGVSLALLFAAAGATGCDGCDVRSRSSTIASALSNSSGVVPQELPPLRPVLDFVSSLAECDIEHRGLLIDLGTDMIQGRLGWRADLPRGMESVEHDGSTWARVSERRLDLTFTLLTPTPVFVAGRFVGRGARSATVTLDGLSLGTLQFGRDQARIASVSPTSLPVDAGTHTLSIVLAGRPRNDRDTLAEVDWVRVGIPDEDPTPFGAPTLRDLVVAGAALGGVPHRSIALRGASAVRCPLRIPQGAHLRGAVGLMGSGEGEAEIRLLRDGTAPLTLSKLRVTGGERAIWTQLDLALDQYAGAVTWVELRATQTTPGSRLLFGDIVVGLPTPAPPAVPAAKAVVMVVLDGVERSELPPWGPAPNLPTLRDLSTGATVFERHRAPSTVVAATVASLLTGLPPTAHLLTDKGARLPQQTTTIGSVARDASVRTAMFTGVPSTFAAFGFAAGWEKYASYPPQHGAPASAPLDDAAVWIAEVSREAPSARILLVVHARGGHPPWDVLPKELAGLPPAEYSGLIEPRRAAQILATARQKRGGLSAGDRERLRALESLALAGQDRALGGLVSALKAAGLWDGTLFMVTGDVSSGRSDGALFADALPLTESVLTLPLYVRFPGGLYAGTRVQVPTQVYDLSRTSLAALRLEFDKVRHGHDLAALASKLSDAGVPPQVATLGDRYSARWGELVLTGRFHGPPNLCDLALDPTCAFNRQETMPLTTQAFFRRLLRWDLATRAPISRREPVTMDPETVASMSVWGDE